MSHVHFTTASGSRYVLREDGTLTVQRRPSHHLGEAVVHYPVTVHTPPQVGRQAVLLVAGPDEFSGSTLLTARVTEVLA